MKRLFILLLLFTVGCSNSETTESRQLNTEWVTGQQEINRTIIKLIETLNKDGEIRTVDFESLGLKPYSK